MTRLCRIRPPSDCPEAAYGHHSTPDPGGRCYWCRRRIDAPARAPGRLPVSDLTEAYDTHYNPDWGGAR